MVGGHDSTGPKTCAVLPQMPSFVFGTACTFCRGNLLDVSTGSAIFGREDEGAGFAQNILFCVSEESFRARIPGQDAGVRIKGDERIVLQPVQEQAHTLLSLPVGFAAAFTFSKLLLKRDHASF